ncbi:TPA: hypothetical protein DCE37_13060 [Candidatus Latescibacteria bacterium]|nr:hypothetical protein [Candidatus Latescibacterota bacterium]
MDNAPTHDVIIAGSGIGGLCATRSAQESGARVLVIEKANQIGGSAAASGGTIWTARNLEEWSKVQPSGNTALGQTLVNGFKPGVEWLRSLGLQVTDVEDRPYKFKRDIVRLDPDPRTAFESLAQRIEADGGTIRTETAITGIERDNGRMSAVSVSTPSGSERIATSALILATGGFQGNAELRARYMGPWSDRMILRGVPENTGDGLLAAIDAGARTSGPFSRFYGHYLPAPPAEVGLHNFVLVKPDFSEYAITINLRGERFDDEFLGDEVTVHSLIHQPEGMGVLLFDQHIRDNMEQYSQWPTSDVDRVRNIRDAGGHVMEADTWKSLAEQMATEWQVPAATALQTISAYNTTCQDQNGTALTVPKSGGLVALETPPYYAVRVLAGITYTYGGVTINPSAEILDSSDRPIPGLYAAGADCGGIYTRGYTGGLSMGLVFGRIAGQTAAAYSRG